jgi:aminoglycoside phosphotransferase (APT) family kinase protein
MTARDKPLADVAIDVELVRELLREQHADLADCALTTLGEGWDNMLYRLGDDLTVRLPRRAAAATLIEHEQRWLPELARRLPLPTPVPRRVGRPGCGYPWSWSIASWMPGENAVTAAIPDQEAAADDVARFLRALHQPAPVDAPHNPWRGVSLSARTPLLFEGLERLRETPEVARRRHHLLAWWDELVATPPWPRPAVWIHGDLHPANLLVDDGCLSGVLDFGDLCAGDPATDLSVAWMLLDPAARDRLRDAACGPDGWLDRHAWSRARGWAVTLAIAFLSHSRNDASIMSIGRRTLAAVLSDADAPRL